jgi:hypothetical protein
MAKRPTRKKAESIDPPEHRGVVVGWTHYDLNRFEAAKHCVSPGA